MENRGLLTEGDREKLEAVDGIDKLDAQTRAELRSNWNKRIDRLRYDIELLRDVGDEKTLDKLFRQATPEKELEQRMKRIEEELGIQDGE